MGKQSAIEWTDHSWNCWYGCLKVSPGCKQCYMYRDMKRYGRDPMVVNRAKPATFNAPLKWTQQAKVFTCSWSDFFIKEADQWRDEAWEIIRKTPHLTYQILTKRPGNIKDRLPTGWGNGWPNVWLGVSVENQEYSWRIFELGNIPATVHFVSYEPALGPLNLKGEMQRGMVDWLISGGESGYKPRPASPEWFRSIRDQCQTYSISFFHKQNGGYRKVDNAWGGRELDGRTWDEMPEVQPVEKAEQLVLM